MAVNWYVAKLLGSPLNRIKCTRQLRTHLPSSLKSLCDCSLGGPDEKQETVAPGDVEDPD